MLCLGYVGIASGRITFGSFCEARVVVRKHVIRVKLNGLVVVRDGAITLTPVVVRAATAVVGIGEPRIEPDRLVVVRDSAIRFAFGTVRDSPVNIGPCEVGTLPKTGID